MRLINSAVLLFFVIIWPLNLFFHVETWNFPSYILPTLIVSLSLVLSLRNIRWWWLPLIILPFINSKFLFSPDFLDHSIFKLDYEAKQKIISNTYLYPNIFFARLFQNKLQIPLSKFFDNLFLLTDPNNYFFGLHPREVVRDNLNLIKFPPLSIFYYLFGIYTLFEGKVRRQFIFVGIALLTNLSLLYNFDRTDIVLMPIILSLLILGQRWLATKNIRLFNLLQVIIFVETIPEIIRILVLKSL